MPNESRKLRKEERHRDKELRKDRLIQTRVDRRLQKVLVERARSRRVSVSNLVRNILEDALGLSEVPEPEPPAITPPALDHVYAWNSVILGREAQCSRCVRELAAGEGALIGLSEDPKAARAWLCQECGEDL